MNCLVTGGRIVALFAFSGALAVQCIQKEMPMLVEEVVDWTVAHIDGHLMTWIVQNGDWVFFIFVAHFTHFLKIFTLPVLALVVSKNRCSASWVKTTK